MWDFSSKKKPDNNELKVRSENEKGSNYQSHCLEIYKLCVEQADAISQRRHSANSFF